MYLIKRKDGLYQPIDEYDIRDSQKIKTGSAVEVRKSRNWKFHKKTFAIFNVGFENQETFPTFEMYRKVITIKAGYFDWAPTKDGDKIPIAHSISYEKMSAETFDKYYDDICQVIADDLGVEVTDLQDFDIFEGII